VPQIAHPDAIAVNLAGVAGSNASLGGANERFSKLSFSQPIH